MNRRTSDPQIVLQAGIVSQHVGAGQVVRIAVGRHYIDGNEIVADEIEPFAREGVLVQPAPMDVLRPLLTVAGYHFEPRAAGGIDRCPQSKPLYHLVGDGLFAPIGCLQRIVRALEAHGYEISIDDRRRFDPALWPARFDPKRFDPAAAALFEALITEPRGYVVVQNAGEIPGLIGLACRLFPLARILIPAIRRDKVLQLHGQLKRLLDEPVHAVFGKNWSPHARVAVCNMQSFNTPCFGDWQLVVFPGVEEAVHRVNWENLGFMDECRVHAFIPAATQPTGTELLQLEVNCGHAIHHRGRCAGSRAVRVVMPRIANSPTGGRRSKPKLAKELVEWQRKQTLVWHNAKRNDAIAAIARAFADADIEALWQHGILVHEAAGWFERQEGRLTVDVLVESVEHARELQRLLPGWKLATVEPHRERKRQWNWAAYHALDRQIVTARYVERCGLEADVVVRADATASRWNHRCGCVWRPTAPPIVLVDFFDDFDERATEDACRRLKDYQSRGWPIDAPPGAIEQASAEKQTPALLRSRRTTR